jgi:hypothetical protein
MKKLALMTVFALLIGTGSLALADTTTASVTPHPRIHEVHTRMHDQMARIRAGVKSGKLTQAQADALIVSLKAVREQMQADFSTNGSRDLTDDQLKQLNQMLNENSTTIYGEKHDTGSTGDSTAGSTADSSATGSSPTGASSTGSSLAGSSATGSSSTAGNTAPSGN